MTIPSRWESGISAIQTASPKPSKLKTKSNHYTFRPSGSPTNPTMPSADSCRHIPAPHDASSTTAHRQASPGNAHSPSRLSPPHIRPCFPCKNRTSEIFASSSSMTASNAIPVRQASALPSASFRFHLTMNTLAVQLTVPLAGPAENFHLQVNAPCRAHKGKRHSVSECRLQPLNGGPCRTRTYNPLIKSQLLYRLS